MLFLRLASDLIGNLALLLLLVDGNAAFDIVLELPALSRGQLVQLKFEHFTRVARQTLLHQVDYPPLLLLSQLTNVYLQLILLLYVHGFVRISGLLCEHNVVFDLRLRPLILVLVAEPAVIRARSLLHHLLSLNLRHLRDCRRLHGRGCGSTTGRLS